MSTTETATVLIDRVRALAPMIRGHAARGEEDRRLPLPVFEGLVSAGLYNMSRPKAFGGLELDPITMFEVIEEIARHDAATAWNVQIANGGQVFVTWLSDEAASEIVASK